jgi:hypothetical protein
VFMCDRCLASCAQRASAGHLALDPLQNSRNPDAHVDLHGHIQRF